MISRRLLFIGLILSPFILPAQEQAEPRKPEIINFAAFIPNQQLVTVGYEEDDLEPNCHGVFNGHILSLWDMVTGKRLEKLKFEENLEETAVSADGKYLASWHTEECDHFADGAIRLYTLEREDHAFGTPIGTLGGPTAHAVGVTFSPDSKRIAAGYDYGYYPEGENPKPGRAFQKDVRVWDVAGFSEYSWLTTDKTVGDLRFSPDAKYLAAKDNDGTSSSVYFWDLGQKKKLGKVPIPEHEYEFGFTPDSQFLVIPGSPAPVSYVLATATSASVETRPVDRSLAETAMDPPGITIEENESLTSVSLIRKLTGEAIVCLKRVPPRGKKKDVELDIPLNSGVLSFSKDGRYAVVDSQLLDLTNLTLKDLDLLRPKGASTWKVEKPDVKKAKATR